MSELTSLSKPIDPEFAEVYEQASKAESVPRKPESNSASSNRRSSNQADEGDGFEALEDLAAIAIDNERNSIDRKKLSGFDQIENDVSNAIKVGWQFLTR